jgi:hypothetical protein
MSLSRLWEEQNQSQSQSYFTTGGLPPISSGVEYLHRDPASSRRRRKGKSQIWDGEIWSRVPRDSDPRMNALAKASSKCKWQTHPLVREDAL